MRCRSVMPLAPLGTGSPASLAACSACAWALGTSLFANDVQDLFALGLQHDEVAGGFGFEFVKHVLHS